MKKILILGGGAAGLAAAVQAARRGAQVVLAESGARVGQKLLRTGNGRCNFTNLHIGPEGYNHPDFVRPVLARYDCAAIRSFFGELGLASYADDAGRVYPRSDAAASVLDVLRLACRRYGVEIVDSFEAVRLTGTQVQAKDGRMLSGDAVITATGGGTKLLASVGHRLMPFSPVLCPLAADTAPIRGLSGIRVKCALTLTRGTQTVAAESGELLFRDYGVSGIAVFDLSRFAEPGDRLHIDLLPEMTEAQTRALFEKRVEAIAWCPREEILTGLFHKRVNEALLRACGTDAASLAHTAKDLVLRVSGPAEPKQAQLTRGGADTAQFDPETLRSRLVPTLYAAGETLDIDGRCGGCNLHWAFASGLRAAESAL